MHSQKQRRRRGVVLTPQGLKKLQTAKSEAERHDNNERRYTLEELNIRTGLDPDTLMRVFTCETGVDKRTLDRCFRAFNLLLEQSDYDLPTIQLESVEAQGGTMNQALSDWGEAPESGVFYGRTEELATLTQWIVEERCRLVTILGIGGMGKTVLSVQLAEQIQDKFEFLIWRSLRHAPPIQDTLAQLIRFLSKAKETELSDTVDGRISQLIHYLRVRRCLLLFDNIESLLQGCNQPRESCNYSLGQYHKGYETYGELFKRVGEARHQSCLILTSREKPKEIGLLEGESLSVRILQVKGLQLQAGQEIFRTKGSFRGTLAEWNQLIEYYAGNPLVLKIVSTTIHKLFDGNVSEFLKQNTAVFGKIRNLLEQQFERLSDAEKAIIKWMAIHRHPTSFSQLREHLSPPISPQKLLEALESLEERSLIDKKAGFFSTPPMVMEYATHQFSEEQNTGIQSPVSLSNPYQTLASNS
jgi:DNA-binding HxlR family transcriptional regulator